MEIKAPDIDKRNADALLREVASLAPFYTPEWSPDKEDAGYALSKVFSYLMESVIERLNRVPGRTFTAYLDRLGLKLLPARPATAPITFAVSAGTKKNVLVPQKTRISSKDIVFETERSIVATPAQLIKAYSVTASADGIYESPPDTIAGAVSRQAVTSLLHNALVADNTISLVNVEGFSKGDLLLIGSCAEYAIVSGVSQSELALEHQLEADHPAGSAVEKVTAFSLFEGKNLQEHILYLGHDDNLKLNGGARILVRTVPSVKVLSDETRVEWEYWGDDKDRRTGWHRLNLRQNYPSEFELSHRENKDKLDLSGERPGAAELFLEKDMPGATKRLKVHGKESFWIRCRVKRELSPDDPLSHIKIDFLSLAAVPWPESGKGTTAEAAFSNDVPLDTDVDGNGSLNPSIYPFGRLPRIYDTFYIASSEAFSKKGSEITLSFDLRDTAAVPIKKVQGIGSVYANRLREAGINTVEELMSHSPEELMRMLKTGKKNAVANIIEAARKSYY
ncbi:MAG TPA: helix-hairpin-helix domain-containing protein, partial [Thermodesulfovibrionales bacterium]|nr:helix-hairpin-helix domain-containing protein [Thermodesulfovibrionales bacterium]